MENTTTNATTVSKKRKVSAMQQGKKSNGYQEPIVPVEDLMCKYEKLSKKIDKKYKVLFIMDKENTRDGKEAKGADPCITIYTWRIGEKYVPYDSAQAFVRITEELLKEMGKARNGYMFADIRGYIEAKHFIETYETVSLNLMHPHIKFDSVTYDSARVFYNMSIRDEASLEEFIKDNSGWSSKIDKQNGTATDLFDLLLKE